MFVRTGCGAQQFDYDEGHWKWDLPRIQAMEYTDNVVEFMAQDLRNLPQKAPYCFLQQLFQCDDQFVLI